MLASRPFGPHVVRPRQGRVLSTDERLEMIAGEFRALPGLRLSIPQACRLWSLEPEECDRLFARLIERRMLRRTADGCYMRADLSPVVATLTRPRGVSQTSGVA